MLDVQTLTNLVALVKKQDAGEDSTRTPEMLAARKSRAVEIQHFITQCTPEDVSSLDMPQKEQYAFLLYDLSLVELETGDQLKSIQYATNALAILDKEANSMLYASLLHIKAVSQRELKNYDEALKTFSQMRDVLLRHSITGSSFISLRKAQITLGVSGYQDHGIVYLRLNPTTKENLLSAIDLFDQAAAQLIDGEDPTKRDMIFVRVYSYLALAHVRFLESFGDDANSTHRNEALVALQKGEEIARVNGQLETINQDVATLYFHFSRYYNYTNKPEDAFCYAVRALAIRANVFFRLSSKIDELYTQLEKAWGNISDRSQLKDVCPLLEKIHRIQTTPHPNNYENRASETLEYLSEIPSPIVAPRP